MTASINRITVEITREGEKVTGIVRIDDRIHFARSGEVFGNLYPIATDVLEVADDLTDRLWREGE